MPNNSHELWRRTVLLTVLSGVVAIFASGASWLLLRLINILTHIALYHEFKTNSVLITHVSPLNVLIAVSIGSLVVACLAYRFPIIRGHGLPEAMDAVLSKDSRIKPSTAIVKPLSAAIAIGTGGPFGAEGPIIVTGGALGSILGQVISVSPSERKILLAAGAAAGMAATFGTPLAAVILAVELLLFEFSTRSFVPLVVASAVASGFHAALFGSDPLFHVPPHNFDGLEKLPLFVVLGLLCGGLAVIAAKGLFATERFFDRLPVNQFWHPLIGGIGFAAIGCFVPRALGVGYGTIGDILNNHLALNALITVGIAKMLMWWWAIASGTSGGTLAPMLLIGGSFGAVMGTALEHILPGANVSGQGFALVAMAAVFGASTRTTFASIVFLFELTRDYQVILPLMLACVVARLVTDRFLEESVMTEKLARRGVRVPSDYTADPLRAMTVGVIMSQVQDVTSADGISVPPNMSALMALKIMIDTGATGLNVESNGERVGYCQRDDILHAREHQFVSEARQQGWWSSRPSRRNRRSRTSA